MDHYDEPGLLIAPRITPEIAERCRELDIPFIDTAGNAYLHAPGLLVFVKGQRLLDDDTNRWRRTPCRHCDGTARYIRIAV